MNVGGGDQAPQLTTLLSSCLSSRERSEPNILQNYTMSEPVRLSKRMSELGLSSRREADEWIERGWVLVDGVAAVLGQKVTPENTITIQKAATNEQAQRVTVLINKPT
jgi:ribosomal 50S subunit-recycling heat shock protein